MSTRAFQQPNWSPLSVGLALQDDPSVVRTTTMKCRMQFCIHFHYLPLPTVLTENATKSQLSQDTGHTAESPTNIYGMS